VIVAELRKPARPIDAQCDDASARIDRKDLRAFGWRPHQRRAGDRWSGWWRLGPTRPATRRRADANENQQRASLATHASLRSRLR
jgi:hypothetical protein